MCDPYNIYNGSSRLNCIRLYGLVLKAFYVLLFQDMSSLGDVRHLSQVKVETLAGEKFDQIFVLFANDLLMLSMSPRLSGYQYEVKLSL